MRVWVPCLILAAATGLAVAQDAPTDEPKKYHSVDCEVVSADTTAMTITVKVDADQQTTKVSPLAKTRLGEVKAGDKVTLSCKDAAAGQHEVVAIRPAKAAKQK